MKAHALKDARRIAYQAIDQGATATGPGKVQWDVSGKVLPCSSPPTVEIRGYQAVDRRLARFAPEKVRRKEFDLSIECEVRCRKCPNCLRARAALWRGRAKAEVLGSQRTWFGTLTMRPSSWFEFLNRARVAAASNGDDFEKIEVKEQQRLLSPILQHELSLYLKRIRKNSDARMRYLLVQEHHKSGIPHWHLLVHELPESPLITGRLLSTWPHGFSQWRLVPPTETKHAAYICKYIAKSAISRVRASAGYGHNMAVNTL
jgi:hypothetical protein